MSVQIKQPSNKNDSNQSQESVTSQGRLTIVGCGLHPGHMTMETESHIKNADIVLVVAPNPLSIQHICQLNPVVENLGLLYEGDVNRLQTYHLMADRMVELASQGQNVCAIYYGHPGIFVLSTHMAMERLEEAGIPVNMLPGISADACLFADLNMDPATTGCQSYEATQFLLSERSIDTGAALILWQVGLVGEHTLKGQKPGKHGLAALTRLLKQDYPGNHKMCIYEAPTLPGFEPHIDWMTLDELANAQVSSISTLVIPPASELKFAKERLAWLHITNEDLSAWDDA